jgi:hypothetical protein
MRFDRQFHRRFAARAVDVGMRYLARAREANLTMTGKPVLA